MFNIPTNNAQKIFITGANRYDIDGSIHCSVHSLAAITDNGFGFAPAVFPITVDALEALRAVELPATVECEMRQGSTKNRAGKTIATYEITGIVKQDAASQRPTK